MAESMTVEVDGISVNVSNPKKVLYPEADVTKADIVGYYEAIAPVMVPHLAGRPLTMNRFPNGVDKPGFYEKRSPRSRPPFVDVVTNVLSRHTLEQVTATNAATLVWMANLGSLEIHPGLSVAPDLDVPTKMTFDLDPGAPATIVECCQVALVLKTLFDQLGLQAFPKTSGSKGVHVDVPLNTPTTFADTRKFANAVAVALQTNMPDLVVSDMTKALRHGKVLIDWSQNDRSKTTVAAYSMRARTRPWVSTPLRWEEVEKTAKRKKTTDDALRFEFNDVRKRVDKDGDLHADVATLQQHLPDTNAGI
jgi:bifunctional non-homologous end joining protein LigD